jgi:phospholipase D1/2
MTLTTTAGTTTAAPPAEATAPAPRRPRRPVAAVGLAILAAVALVVLWRATPLATLIDPRRLAALGAAVHATPLAPALVLAVYLAAALVLFPLTPLLVATALVFEPSRALAFGLGGALAGAAVTYGVGRLVGRRRPALLTTERFARVRERLRRRGVLAVAVMRLVPAGNFSLSNVAAGALEIPFRDFMLGNLLGLLPGLLALTLLADHLRALGWLLH